MKNMQKFAAQQLSKSQMNQVTGGGEWFCRSFNSKGDITGEFNVKFADGDEELAKDSVARTIGAGQEAVCWKIS